MRVQRNIKSVQLTRRLFFVFFNTICGWNARYSWFREPHNQSLVFPPLGVASSDPWPVPCSEPTSWFPPFHTACEDLTSHVKLGSNPLLPWCVHIYIKYWLIVIYTTQSLWVDERARQEVRRARAVGTCGERGRARQVRGVLASNKHTCVTSCRSHRQYRGRWKEDKEVSYLNCTLECSLGSQKMT